MNPPRAVLVFTLGLGISCALDIVSKQLIWNMRPDLNGYSLFGLLHFQFYQNTGLMLGFGDFIDASYRAPLLSAVSGLVLVGVAGFLLYKRFTRVSLALAWGVVIGTGLANMIERIRLGAVTDFLQFQLGGYHSGFFNLADAMNSLSLIFIAAMVVFRNRAL